LPEKWKPVVGFEGLYEVSNRGRVRSVDRKVKYSSRYGTFWMKFKGRILNLHENRAGYMQLTLSKNNNFFLGRVHKLVLEAFVCKKPKGLQCRHLDGNPSNNKLNNLKWGTSLEDRFDMIRHGRSLRGERHHMAKLRVRDVLYIRASKERGLAKKFNVSRTIISNIRKGRTWSSV